MAIDRKLWPRCFAHVDMVSFFASVEQLDFPELKGKPVAVINGNSGTTIITSSYEARHYGIKTGTKLYEAKELCPQLIVRVGRPERYAEISSRIMAVLEQITPDTEIYSIDECFLELTHVLNLYPSVEAIGEKIHQLIKEVSQLPCSIGISEGKLTAKYCAEKNKGGITIVPPNKTREFIASAKIGEICGIGKKLERYLNALGIFYCGDMARFPMSILSRRFGAIGKRLYLTCLGHDPAPLMGEEMPKSMGHGKILPPNCKNFELISRQLLQQCERLSARLRRHQLSAKKLFIGYRLKEGWKGLEFDFAEGTQNSREIWQCAEMLLKEYGGEGVFQVQITASHILPLKWQQRDLFHSAQEENKQQKALDQVKDLINQKFGKNMLKPASLLNLENNYTVIAPAWRPKGVRKTE